PFVSRLFEVARISNKGANLTSDGSSRRAQHLPGWVSDHLTASSWSEGSLGLQITSFIINSWAEEPSRPKCLQDLSRERPEHQPGLWRRPGTARIRRHRGPRR